MFIDSQSSRLTSALATLRRGAAFFGDGLRTAKGGGARSPVSLPPGSVGVAGRCDHKVIGNGLRELDRFLSVLIDEVAGALPPRHVDTGSLARQRNTPNKLRALHTAMGRPSPDHDRLRAIGRSRDCLFYCDGIVTRSDSRHGGTMTVGWPCGEHAGGLGRSIAIGERLVVTPANLVWISAFYDRLAMDLVAASSGRPGALVDMDADLAYMQSC